MTTKTTRTQMLDAINMKIARTGGGTGPGETGYFLPVMIGDVLDWWDTYETHEENYPVWFNTIIELVELWFTKREPLSAQNDECISYIYNLISNDN